MLKKTWLIVSKYIVINRKNLNKYIVYLLNNEILNY